MCHTFLFPVISVLLCCDWLEVWKITVEMKVGNGDYVCAYPFLIVAV